MKQETYFTPGEVQNKIESIQRSIKNEFDWMERHEYFLSFVRLKTFHYRLVMLDGATKFSGSWTSTYRPRSTECLGEYNVCATRQSTVLRGWTSTNTAPALQSLRNVKPASLEGNTYKWGKASLLKGSFSVQRRSKENILLILGIVTLPRSSDGTNNACNSYWFDAHEKARLQHRTLWTQTNFQWMM